MQDDNISIEPLYLRLSEQEKRRYHSNIAKYNKIIGRQFSEARKRSKRLTCYVCKKPVSSFCNSHSVPRFCLERIAIDGKVLMSGIQQDIPYLGEDTGVNSAGTFRIICQNCDNTIFQQYEDPSSYVRKPSGQMLAQIAMKNYLQMIYKRNLEQELFSLLEEQRPDRIDVRGLHEIKALDLAEYTECYNRAKIASNGHHNDWYYLCYYVQLDYTVPIAFQGQVALISDFEDNVINDIYNPSNDYKTQDLNLVVFPLENSSVVFAFIDSRHKRYRNFIRKLNSLDSQNQLSIINYIIFKYSENVFLSKAIPETVLKNQYFLDACGISSTIKTPTSFLNPLEIAIENFSLSNHKDVPNLLGPTYAI